MNFLLDTCTFLWLAASPDRISEKAAAAINDEFNTLYLSDVSIWEISTKHRAGKLPLPKSPRVWIPAQISFFKLRHLPITRDALFLCGELPLLHRDPFDCLLAAQAQTLGFTVLTPDSPFIELGTEVVW